MYFTRAMTDRAFDLAILLTLIAGFQVSAGIFKPPSPIAFWAFGLAGAIATFANL